jgi:branched-chain amino acid aminotransferase
MMFWMDGERVEPTTGELMLMDPASPDTFGVFETMRSYNGAIFQLERHLERLEHSARIIGLELPCSLKQIDRYLKRSVPSHPNEPSAGQGPVRIKCVATDSHVYLQVLPLSIDPLIYNGVSTVLVRKERPCPEAKSLPYYSSYIAQEEARQHGAYEAILVDADGFITEGAFSNIFWVKAGKLFTRNDKVLGGVTRSVIEEIMPTSWGKIRAKDVPEADEIFLSKTSTGPVPITSIDGHAIADGKPGKITLEVLKRFEELTASIFIR